MPPILYLASASPRRQEILARLKVPFKTVKSAYHEKPSQKIHPRKLVMDHAAGKALLGKVPKNARWVLGADTEVYGSGRIFGKPKSEADAFKMLSLLNGRPHWVYTGVALLDRQTGKIRKQADKTRVTFKKWPPEKLRAYIRHAQVLDKAGAYGIQMKPKIVKKIKGSYSNVVGLPGKLVLKLLRSAGFWSNGGRR